MDIKQMTPCFSMQNDYIGDSDGYSVTTNSPGKAWSLSMQALSNFSFFVEDARNWFVCAVQ